MALTVNVVEIKPGGGMDRVAVCEFAFDSSYNAGGEVLTPAMVGLSNIQSVDVSCAEAGYVFEYDKTNQKIKVYEGGSSAHTHAVGTLAAGAEATHTHAVTAQATDAVSGGTPAGTVAVTGAVPFTGTGITALGQVMTTTDNQTMTLDQCAGMWLYSTATPATPPVLIVSNTAVVGAPAVFTVVGVAFTDAGAYAVASNTAAFTGAALGTHSHSTTGTTDAGASHTHAVSGATASTTSAALPLSEVAPGTDLSGLTVVEATIIGI